MAALKKGEKVVRGESGERGEKGKELHRRENDLRVGREGLGQEARVPCGKWQKLKRLFGPGEEGD